MLARTLRRSSQALFLLAMLPVALLGAHPNLAFAQATPPAPPPAAPPAATPPPASPPAAKPPTATPPPASSAPASPPPATSAAPAPTPPPPTATPPAPPTPAQLAEAKKFFTAGLKLYKQQLFQEALASFVEAYRIAPRESIARNIAQTHRDMKDSASAYNAYDDMLTRFPKMTPKAVADTKAAMEELAVLTGLIDVKVQEPGAKVTLDNKDLGTTPLPKPVRVNIGQHSILVTKDGFEPITKQVEIHGHDTVVVDDKLAKAILTGHVIVNASPADATAKVLVDGKEVGAPPWEGDLDPGMHTIEAKGDSTIAAPKQVDVQKKGRYEVALELKTQQGIVSISVGSPDAEITVDAKVVGHGAWEAPLSAGKHDLQVTRTGFLPYKKTLIVHNEEHVVENVVLEPEKAVATGPIDQAPEFRGVYGQLNLIGLFEVTNPSNDIAQGAQYDPSTAVSTSGVFGGMLNIRVGYSFGFIGVEGFIMGGYDHSSSTAEVTTATATHPGNVPYTDKYDFHRLGADAGLAVRLMPKTQIFRPTLGIGGGLGLKAMGYSQSITDHTTGTNNSYAGDLASYIVPCMAIDGGFELGSTPGTRFYLGALLLAEFAGSASTKQATPNFPAGPPGVNGNFNVVNGTDIFFGPIVGMQFGE